MKLIKIIVLVFTFSCIFLFTTESFSFPRHRFVRGYRWAPRYRIVAIQPYYVPRPEVIVVKHRHHHKRVRLVIY